MTQAPVLTFTEKGIYCAAGDFYIDPWRPVARALITHGHSDHARPGHAAYLATDVAAPVIRHRLGSVVMDTIAFGETRQIGGVTVSFHPAGHVPGSAQIRVERAGEVWVVSGDYKVAADGLSEPFAPVTCHAFISECTFGLPVFHWQSNAAVMDQINRWWAENAAAGRASIIGAYALGKAQRIMAGVDASIGPIITHGAVEATNAVMRAQGIILPPTQCADGKAAGALVIAPPSALGSVWAGRFGPASQAFASGWMALRGVRRRRGMERGFVISDHADWTGLNDAIRATGAERVFVTHGYTTVFRKWLESQGYDAGIVATEYEGEGFDAAEPEAGEPPEVDASDPDLIEPSREDRP